MVAHRFAMAWSVLVLGVACADTDRGLTTGLGDVRVLETSAPDHLPSSPGPLGTVLVPDPELLYAEPAPLPVKHTVRAGLRPTGAPRLRDVQAAEVEVEVSGGALGARELSALFVSPQGLAWERQSKRVSVSAGATVTVRFTLPVANTLIEDQGLAGRWSVTTLDDGVEQASTTFEVAP